MSEINKEPGTDSGVTEYFEGYQQLELESIENNLRKTRTTMFVVAGLVALTGLILYATGAALLEDLWILGLLVIAYIGLGFLTNKIPMTSVVIALVLFIAIWVLDIVVGGVEYIWRGIIVKAAIIFYLIKGIGYAREAEELRKRMNTGGR